MLVFNNRGTPFNATIPGKSTINRKIQESDTITTTVPISMR